MSSRSLVFYLVLPMWLATDVVVFADPPTANLALWLDANDVNGTGSNLPDNSSLGTWADKSGTENSALQAATTNRPMLRLNAIGTNATVRFDGSDWMLAGTLRSTAGNLHAFVVSKRAGFQLGGDGAQTYQRLVSTSDGGDGFDWQPPDWTVTSAYDGSGNSVPYGPDFRTASTTNGTLKIVNLTLGRDAANGFSRFKGDIGEILVYTNTLNAANLAAVTNYLATKWLVNTNSPPPPRPLVGAIRWDAWVGTNSGVGLAVEKSLGPQHWHHRLPYFGAELSATQVVARSVTQADADRQIAYARAAGLDYWAFVMYSTTDPMTRYGLDLYLASSQRDDIRFCMINQGQPPAQWPAFQARMLGYFAMSNHVTVAGGRPLFYLFNPAVLVSPGYYASWPAAKAAFDQLRAAATNAGLAKPYFVAMEFNPTTAKTYMDNLGFDAISTYAHNGNHSAASYATLDNVARVWWNDAKNTGAAVVPSATVGWDRRPRVENPVPWESWQVPGAGIDKYYAAPTPAEWRTHLQTAVNWVQANPAQAPANSVLIYAWNEIDEGGWLLPTHTENTARLAAMRDVQGTSPDADEDEMDDLWEIWHLGSTTNGTAASDSDGDGATDQHEFVAGTDPTNRLSRLALTALTNSTLTVLTLAWPSVSGKYYHVEASTNLVAPMWGTNSGTVVATPPMNVFTVLLDDVMGFFRVHVSP